MVEKYNWKSMAVSSFVVLTGILFVLFDIFWVKTETNVWISIGCSLIASGLVILLGILLSEKSKSNQLEGWGLDEIFVTRMEMNPVFREESKPNIYKYDVVSLGLTDFRTQFGDKIEIAVNNGLNVRILTMHPEKGFVSQREIEENLNPGTMIKAITDLIIWANEINKRTSKGQIIIKGYTCMTLDFYRRYDDIYVGPYWYGLDGRHTITYKFVNGSKGFKRNESYFEKLWRSNEFEMLTDK